jgi:hypothetical protein
MRILLAVVSIVWLVAARPAELLDEELGQKIFHEGTVPQ